jgi:hypothetical protein
VLVANLSLDVETAISQLADELGLAHLVARNLRTIDGPWARQVMVHTISKIKKRIPEGLNFDRAACQQDPASGAHDADRGMRAADVLPKSYWSAQHKRAASRAWQGHTLLRQPDQSVAIDSPRSMEKAP